MNCNQENYFMELFQEHKLRSLSLLLFIISHQTSQPASSGLIVSRYSYPIPPGLGQEYEDFFIFCADFRLNVFSRAGGTTLFLGAENIH